MTRMLPEKSSRRRVPPQSPRLRRRSLGLASALLAAGLSWPHATGAQQSQPAPIPNPERMLARDALADAEIADPGNADIAHGLAIAMGQATPGGEAFAFPCFQCHQIEGEGAVTPGIPRLTGQSFRYLYGALQDFVSGVRPNDIMTPIAESLSDQQMRDVAAYYASETVEQPDMAEVAASKADPGAEVLMRGGAIAAVGLAERGVQACTNCHGPQGAGLPPLYPYLAGQYADYLEAQLKAWKSGQRRGDGFGIMADIARRLTDDDIHAVAEYYASIRPPRTIPQESFAGPVEVGAPLGGTGETGGDASRPTTREIELGPRDDGGEGVPR